MPPGEAAPVGAPDVQVHGIIFLHGLTIRFRRFEVVVSHWS